MVKWVAWSALTLAAVLLAGCRSSTIDAAHGEKLLLKLAQNRFAHDITPSEEALLRAAARGVALDRTTGSTTEDDPAYSESWPADRIIRADRLAWLCADPSATALVDRRGVNIVGLRIEGSLDLERQKVPFLVSVTKSAFGGELLLASCHLESIQLDGSLVKAINASGSKIPGDVLLREGFECEGTATFSGSEIGGNLDCTGGSFNNPGGVAFDGEGMRVEGNVYLTGNFRARGEVHLGGAKVRLDLRCDGAQLLNAGINGYVLTAEQAKIGGSVLLRNHFHSEGGVDLVDANIGGYLECGNGEFLNPNAIALSCQRVTVRSVFLNNDFHSQGMVELSGATVQGDLDGTSGHFSNPDDTALAASGATFKGNISLANSSSQGVVWLNGVDIGLNLECDGARLLNPGTNHYALEAQRAKVGGSVLLRNHFHSEGEVDFLDANIGGTLDCGGGDFVNPNALALSCGRVAVKSVSLNSGFHSQGMVELSGATVQGDLECDGARLVETGINRSALVAQRAKIGGSVFLRNQFRSEGEVDLLDANIGGTLECGNGNFVNPNALALNCAGVMVKGVSLNNDFHSQGMVDLSGATVQGDFDGTSGLFSNPGDTALAASGATFKGNVLFLANFSAQGEVWLNAVDIGLNLDCGGAKLLNPGTNHYALEAQHAKIGGSVLLRNQLHSEGGVDLLGANIGGTLECGNGDLVNPNALALNCESVMVKDIFLNNDFHSQGMVDLSGATVQGDFNGTDGHFSNPDGVALAANGAIFKGNVVLQTNFSAQGGVQLIGVNIGLDFNCEGARLMRGNTNRPALAAQRAKVGGSAFLGDQFNSQGMVDFSGATVQGDFDCTGGLFSNPDDIALAANGAVFKGNVRFQTNFSAQGEVQLFTVNIGLDLYCEGARFVNAGTNRYALEAQRAKIGGGLSLRNQFRSQGEVDLVDANIGATLECGNGDFVNPNGVALDCERVMVKGVILNNDFHSQGKVDFSGATVQGDFDCTSGVFSNPRGEALSAEEIKIDGTLYLYDTQDSAILAGDLDLSTATAGTVWDAEAGSKNAKKMLLDGFVYQRISGPLTNSPRSLASWLRPQGHDAFRPQPYEQLAKVLRSMGREEEAVEIMIEKNREYGHSLPRLSPLRLWYGFFGELIGFGYKSWNALWFSLGFIIVGWVVFAIGYKRWLFEAKDEKAYESQQPPHGSKPSYPKFNSLIYSLETFVPLVKLGVGEYWLPNATAGNKLSRWTFGMTTGSLLRCYYWLHIIAGWVLTTLWVAGFAGLVKT